MKLYRENTRLPRSSRAVEVLGTPEERVDVLFDVEKEVPRDEFEKYKQWLISEEPTNEQEKQNVVASAWYGLLHPEYRGLMRQSSWLKRFWVKYFANDMQASVDQRLKGNRVGAIRSSLDLAGSFVQVFPESRADLKLTENAYTWLLESFPPTSGAQLYNTVVILLELWPERRTIILSTYFPDGAPKTLGVISDNWDLSVRLLVFPQLREAAREHLMQQQDKYKTEVSYWRETFKSDPSNAAGAFNDYLKNLAILSAEQAWIDEAGREHIEMPKAGAKQADILPERSIV